MRDTVTNVVDKLGVFILRLLGKDVQTRTLTLPWPQSAFVSLESFLSP